jgi:hypothetical protein
MDMKRWRVPMAFMMVGVGIAAGQDTGAAGDCYECNWTSDTCRLMDSGESDWGSTSCVGEGQGFEECTLSENGCSGDQN